jgi:predicted nucleic acid-binding Zn ribbon protein
MQGLSLKRLDKAFARRYESPPVSQRADKPKKLGELFPTTLKRMGLERKLDDYRAWDAWDEVVGPAIARNAQPTRLDGDRLIVAVRNSSWLQELDLLKKQLRERLNEKMGRQLVAELYFFVGKLDQDATNDRKRNREALDKLWKNRRLPE